MDDDALTDIVSAALVDTLSGVREADDVLACERAPVRAPGSQLLGVRMSTDVRQQLEGIHVSAAQSIFAAKD